MKLRRPNPVIGYTTALALILAGCAIKFEPTDLSAVTVENDRTVIEKTLSKPDEVVEAQGFTVASYKIDGYQVITPPYRLFPLTPSLSDVIKIHSSGSIYRWARNR